ncbi:MAG: alpha-L-fucosidase [Bacteroidota bacterium]
MHWGVYAVPAYNGVGFYAEWYPREMYRKEHDTFQYHAKKYGPQGEFGYADFIKDFTAKDFNADEWASLFKSAGAKIVVPVGEHHDGFAMWDSDLTKWDAKDMGPKRDIIGELAVAVRKQGMKFAASYHRERHFAYYLDHGNNWMEGKPLPGVQAEIKRNPELEEFYGPFELNPAFLSDYKARWDEICEKYQPDMMWFDGMNLIKWHPKDPRTAMFQDTLRIMVTEYLNNAIDWGKEVAINNKGRGPNFPKSFGIAEQDYMVKSDIPNYDWICSRGMGTSYGINLVEEEKGNYPSVDELIELLIDVTSKNGFFLLNIGPKADGTISKYQEERLRGMGKWLEVNGEAIFGTRPWKTYGRDNLRYTTKGDDLYVHVLTHPGMYLFLDSDLIDFKPDTKVIWLQTKQEIRWNNDGHREGKGVKLRLPMRDDTDSANPLNSAYVFKILGGAK